MNFARLTEQQSAAIRASYAATLQASRDRRAKDLAERALRAELRLHHWSDSAIVELIDAHGGGLQ
jgi:hypothetical protein